MSLSQYHDVLLAELDVLTRLNARKPGGWWALAGSAGASGRWGLEALDPQGV